MKITKTKKATSTVAEVIAKCQFCRKKYFSWSGLVDYPICPYCGKKEKPEGILIKL